MKCTWLRIQPNEPLIFGWVKAGTNVLSSLPYLPGRVLRGAWADWLVAHGRERQIVPSLQHLRFGNFFPVADWRPISYVSPYLLSMLTCRTSRGFLSEPHRESAGHGVVDTLLARLSYYLLKQAGAAIAAPFVLECAQCQSRMEVQSGFYAVYQGGDASWYVRTRERYHTQTRVALSRFRRAAAQGMLYTATALSPELERPDKEGQASLQFCGRVYGSEEIIEELIQALNATPIGAMRTRGYGKIKVKVEETIGRTLPALPERLERFNRMLAELYWDLKRLAANADDLPEAPTGLYFSVDLLAPGVFLRRGIPSLVPELQVAGYSLYPVFWLTRPDFAGGWSEAWGLPKPTALAATMGSVYVFHWLGDREVLIEALEHLEGEGVGERSDEGFGECWVCHPFHLEVDEK